MCLTLQTFGLLVTIASLSTATFGTQKHHKVRHKHNMHHLRGSHVNKIREAFDEYRHVVHKNNLQHIPEIADISLSDYDEAIGDDFERASWAAHKNDALKFAPIAEPSNFEKNFIESEKTRAKLSSDDFVRHKRLHVSTTSKTTHRTGKSIDNYDDEYNDDDNNTANRRLNDDAQKDLVRLNRDVS